MTNAPFRVAFWTMCCAFLLSFAMIASSPEAGRFVTTLMHPELAQQAAEIAVPEVVLGQDQKLSFPIAARDSGGHVPVPDPYAEPTLADRPRPAEAGGSSWPTTYSPPAMSGVRTASSDPNVVLGMIEQQAPSMAAVEQSAAAQTITTPAIAVLTTGTAPVLDLPVPAPEMSLDERQPVSGSRDFPEPLLQRLQGGVTELRVTQIERELAEARSQERARLHKIADGELTTIHSRLQELRQQMAMESRSAEPVGQSMGSPGSMRMAANSDASGFSVSSAPVSQNSPADESIEADPQITITETDEPGQFNISIRDMEVGEVLRQLGRKLGWRVIIAPEVAGQFTGDFHEADIEQSFVMVVKTHKLGVDRRGDYILIRQHSGHAAR